MGAPWKDHPSWKLVEELTEATGLDLPFLLLDADAETLKATRNAQPAAFALSLVILDAAKGAGLLDAQVSAMAGHSLGEYTALVAAGVLAVAEGARLVAERGEAMQQAADEFPGTMAAVLGLDPETLAEVCASVEGAWVANDNAPGQIVVAGTALGVAAAGEAAKAAGAKRVMPLAVGGAFHSPLMEPATERLNDALGAADFGDGTHPVVANVDAERYPPGAGGWPSRLAAQLCAPVQWRRSLLTLADGGVDRFLELGPGTELSGMVKRTLEGAARANVAVPADLDGLGAFLAPSR
jgi:[acyl-carrier-protein] S-malonyltransferase